MLAPPWMPIAYGELEAHVEEVPGDGDDPRILEYHQHCSLKATKDSVPWCSSFVCAVMHWAGFRSPKSAMARSSLGWGTRLEIPAFGCITVISRGQLPQPGPEDLDTKGHVGFYCGLASRSAFLLLGGNQADSVSVKLQPRERILGFRWPGRNIGR